MKLVSLNMQTGVLRRYIANEKNVQLDEAIQLDPWENIPKPERGLDPGMIEWFRLAPRLQFPVAPVAA